MSQFRIDPDLGDYTIDSNGLPVKTNDLTQAAYIRLRTPRGQWMHDPELGSDYHTLVNRRLTEDVERSIEDFSRAALRPLLEDGRAKQVDVRTVEVVRGGRRIQVTIVDNRDRLLTPLRLLVPIL